MEIAVVDLDSVAVPETRWRTEFNAAEILALADSIERLGLLHAPVTDGDLNLIAGERRLRAIRLLNSTESFEGFYFNGREIPRGKLPVVVAGQLNSRGKKEAELEENTLRVELRWQDRASAIRQLYERRQETGEPTGDSKTKVAEDTGFHRRTVDRDLIAAEFLDDPDVRKAKTRDEALKIIEHKVQDAKRKALAAKFQQEPHTARHSLIQGDLREEMPKLPSNHFDVIVADPPYGMEYHKAANLSGLKHTYNDAEEYADEIITTILREGFRATKTQAHLYLFCDISRFPAVKTLASAEGWDVWKTPFIWVRSPSDGVTPRPDHGPRRTYEAILYAIKGSKTVKTVRADVFQQTRPRDLARGAEKPVELYIDFLRMSCDPADVVLDPCCGTGPIFEAATTLDLIATGIESDPVAIGICLERMEKKNAA